MKTTLLLCLLSVQAFAGERFLGLIVATAGPTTKDNSNTAAPFVIPPMAKITIQCDATSYVATDVANGATSANGVKVGVDVAFPTSVSSSKTAISSVPTALVSVIGAAGAANCKVFERTGRE